MWLLLRAYRRTGMRLLLWSGLCFVLLSVNNLLVVFDVALAPPVIDLRAWRLLCSLAAGTVLLFGFIWEAE